MITPVGMADLQARVASFRDRSAMPAVGRLGAVASASPASTSLATAALGGAGATSFADVLAASGSTSTTAPAFSTATAGPVQGVPYADLFNSAGAAHGVSPKVLAAVAKVESSYHTDAVSSAGAQGMMQLMPGTAAGLGVNAFDPAAAVDGAARLLASMTARFGSVDEALAAYNIGPGALSRAGGIQPGSQAEKYVNAVHRALEGLA